MLLGDIGLLVFLHIIFRAALKLKKLTVLAAGKLINVICNFLVFMLNVAENGHLTPFSSFAIYDGCYINNFTK